MTFITGLENYILNEFWSVAYRSSWPYLSLPGYQYSSDSYLFCWFGSCSILNVRTEEFNIVNATSWFWGFCLTVIANNNWHVAYLDYEWTSGLWLMYRELFLLTGVASGLFSSHSLPPPKNITLQSYSATLSLTQKNPKHENNSEMKWKQ